MHEMSITQSIVEICTERAAGARVQRVTLEIGALSAVLPDAIRFCFDLCTRDTALEGAGLEIVEIAGRGCCRTCGRSVDMQDFLASCECGSIDVECVAGEALRIREMEVI